MDDILLALAAQHAELAALVDGCDETDWERPTRCEGWDVGSVLLHLAQTDEFASASARGDLDRFSDGLLNDGGQQTVSVDAAADAQVAADRAAGGDAIRQRWHDAIDPAAAPYSPPAIPTDASPGCPASCRCTHSRRRASPNAGSTPAISRPRSTSTSRPPTGCATSRDSRGARSPTRSSAPTPRCEARSRST